LRKYIATVAKKTQSDVVAEWIHFDPNDKYVTKSYTDNESNESIIIIIVEIERLIFGTLLTAVCSSFMAHQW